MPTYKFEQFKVEIVNPTVEVDPIVKEINPNTMTIVADVVLIDSSGSKFGVRLENVEVQNLNYTYQSLVERVMENLEQYIV